VTADRIHENATVTKADGRIVLSPRWARPIGRHAQRSEDHPKNFRRPPFRRRTTKERASRHELDSPWRGRLIAPPLLSHAPSPRTRTRRRRPPPYAGQGFVTPPDRSIWRHRVQLDIVARTRQCANTGCPGQFRSAVHGYRGDRLCEYGAGPLTVAHGAVRVNVLEQNYEYDLLYPDKLLRSKSGARRHAVRDAGESRDTRNREEEVKGGSSATTTRGRRSARVVHRPWPPIHQVPRVPAISLYTHPTLIWDRDNAGAARIGRASYLASKLRGTRTTFLNRARGRQGRRFLGRRVTLATAAALVRKTKLQLVGRRT